MTGRDATWLAKRRLGLGGSCWYHALQIEPTGCPRRLVYEKRGTEPDFPEGEPEGYLIRGHKLEALIAEEAEEALGFKLRRQTRLARAPWLPDWWIGNVDRMIVGGGVFEAKSKNPWLFRKLQRDGVPPGEIAQCQHYLALADRDECLYFCLEPVSWQAWHTTFRRDPNLIQQMLVAGERVWGAVTEGPLPDRPYNPGDRACRDCPFRWTCHGTALFTVGDSEDDGPAERRTLVSERAVELMREGLELRDLTTEAEERLEAITVELKGIMREPRKVLIDGRPLSWITYSQKRFQTAAFRKSYPDLAAQFTKDEPREAFRWG